MKYKSVKKILIVFGTRPEAIKLASIIKNMRYYQRWLKPYICITSQHRQMLEQVLRIFDIKADFDLNIMQENQSLFHITSGILPKLHRVIRQIIPDLILVQGDTTTTFAGALSAFYFKIPVAHIEAGLRTNDKYNPFPEEINRRLTSVIADLHFAPTILSKNNLLREGTESSKIFVTGNTVIDTLMMFKKNIQSDILRRLNIDKNRKIILVTAHRREKFGKVFEEFCHALNEIVIMNKDIELIYPVHLNPNVHSVVLNKMRDSERIHLLKPLDYLTFLYLMKKSYLIITDSGGIQEEAPSLGKPVIVVRKFTERPEGVKEGATLLVGEDRKSIVKTVNRVLNEVKIYRKMAKKRNIYGDGKASQRIIRMILFYFGIGNRPKEFIGEK